MPSILNLKFKGNNSFVAFSNLNDSESLTKTWKVFSKVANYLEEGSRLENLSWRLWHLQNLIVDTGKAKSKREFKNISKRMGDKLDKEKGRSIEELEAPNFTPNHSTDMIQRRAVEKKPNSEASQNEPSHVTSSIDFPGLFGNDFRPSAILYSEPTSTNSLNYGEGRNPSTNDDQFSISRPTIELALEELLLNDDGPHSSWSNNFGSVARNDTTEHSIGDIKMYEAPVSSTSSVAADQQKDVAPETLKPAKSDALEMFFQELERRSKAKRRKYSSSSSDNYETKSGYHSRSSSFSSESHIPGSIRANMEFPFGYPVSIVDSEQADAIDTSAPVNTRQDRSTRNMWGTSGPIVPPRAPSPSPIAASAPNLTKKKRRQRVPTTVSLEDPYSAPSGAERKPLESVLRPPKLEPSAWQLYFTDWIQKQYTSTTRKLNVAQAAKEAGQVYAGLSPSEKEPYQRRSQAMKEAREKEHEAYLHTLTAEDIKRENLFRTAQRKAGKSRRSNIKDPNAPKRPLSAYFMFLQHTRSNPQLAHDIFGDETERTKQSVLTAARWRSMTDAERQPFLAQAEREKMEYEAALHLYEKGSTGFDGSIDFSTLPCL